MAEGSALQRLAEESAQASRLQEQKRVLVLVLLHPPVPPRAPCTPWLDQPALAA
jgi:hypothetical protein